MTQSFTYFPSIQSFDKLKLPRNIKKNSEMNAAKIIFFNKLTWMKQNNCFLIQKKFHLNRKILEAFFTKMVEFPLNACENQMFSCVRIETRVPRSKEFNCSKISLIHIPYECFPLQMLIKNKFQHPCQKFPRKVVHA